MDHCDATNRMAVERYLLDELEPLEREAFEEHLFNCPVCAMDLRAADAFVEQAKQQLPGFPTSSSAELKENKRRGFFSLILSLGPAFAIPAFASLLGLIAYQNLATIPHLREAAAPRVAPWSPLHLGARGAGPVSVEADRKQGAVVLIQLPQSAAYPSYILDFYDAQAHLVWSRPVAAPGPASEGTLSLVIPATGLQAGSSTLAISGVSPQGGRTEIDRRVLDVHFDQ
jgi:anti-sigma factor RsiW